MDALKLLTLFLLMLACLWAWSWMSPRVLTWIAAQCMARVHAIAQRQVAAKRWLEHFEGQQ